MPKNADNLNWKRLSCLILALGVLAGTSIAGTKRSVTNLDRNWKFGSSNAETPAKARASLSETVQLPHTWNNEDIQSGGKYATGGGWYEKSLDVSKEELSDHEVFIRFEGVCSVADVYVNDKFLGEHKGGFSAFCFNASPLLKPGVNTIDVRADNTPRPDVIPINMDLFALFGGIYRHVDLIETPKVAISPIDWASPGVFVDESNVSAREAILRIRVDEQNFTPRFQEARLKVSLLDPQGKTVGQGTQVSALQSGPIIERTVSLQVMNPHLWQGRIDPYLYRLKVSLLTGQGDQDEVDQSIGIRTFGVEPGKGFYLNGKSYRLYGVCRHQDFDHEGNAMSDTQQIADAQMIHEIGATGVRLAHYQQADVIYSAFDRNGVVVWAESPFVNASSGKEEANALQQYKELILQNYNHASIAFWGSSNEVYGKTAESYVPTVIRELALEAKELDPSRLSSATSGAGNPFGPEYGYADIQGVNRYYGWYYGKVPDLETWFKLMAKDRPGLNFALTEYGAEANLLQQAEVIPEKVNAEGNFFPEGLQTKIHEESWLIIKNHPECVGSFIWNMFDFTVPGWNRGGMGARNMKGLVSYDRKTKKDAYFWYRANWTHDPILRLVGRRANHRTLVQTPIELFCNFGKPQLLINGVSVKVHQGVNSVDWVTDPIALKFGVNSIQAKASKGGQLYSDSMSWVLSEAVNPAGATSQTK